MPAYYKVPLSQFIDESPSTIVGELALANSKNDRFALSPESIDAWKAQLPGLQAGFRDLAHSESRSSDWHVLLEYPIPRVGKRIDCVLIAHDVIVVIETKTGKASTSAERQADDYAIHLACFHEPSANQKIVPMVVSQGSVTHSKARAYEDPKISNCEVTSSADFGRRLERVVKEKVDFESQGLSADNFDKGRFRPIPPIIDAAVKLYSEMEVFEIGHASSAREDLQKATDSLRSIVVGAQTGGYKAVCFVTGVPGAGKTLVGLNAVHDASIRQHGAFLSGNGPLVKIVREALIRDVISRPGKTRARAELEVMTFIQSVHRFADDHYGEDALVPAQRVLVFDEAQRAWDADQNERAGRPSVSEAHMMLDVMNRHEGWAVLVALVGGGQEINRGEAGLAEWGKALHKFPEWRVFASPEVLHPITKSFTLFENNDRSPNITECEPFHLKVSNRSIRADRMASWVDAVLRGSTDSASSIARSMSEPPFLTRSVETLRSWLRSRQRGFTRAGLVASASAARLRADGIETNFEFHQRFDWERWFLDRDFCDEETCSHRYCNDVRASSKLEVAGTQFEVQGLELDWVGLCWGEDLIWQSDSWLSMNFNGKKWRENENPRKHEFRVNGYRVLLTRARQGLAIYIPRPTSTDGSRMHEALDETATYLLSCGVAELVELN